ncbi:hypothetical protein DVH24_019393 [Malus domestica]|uniref:Uncharacterized protein n=1 Tax=Malus domestica TaxID=3750 RepID=A0A498I384_MALDO|nr:hypothetical protein DVH24_019393 [Malus domestica]
MNLLLSMETCDKLTHKRDAKSNCIQASARYWTAGRSALTNTMTKDIHALRTVQALTTLVTASIIVNVSAAATGGGVKQLVVA